MTMIVRQYIELMAEWCRRCGVDMWAYCLMPRHTHFIAVPQREDSMRKGNRRSISTIYPDGKPFAVCLTHDVDAVSAYSLKQSSRSRCSQLINSGSVFQKAKSFAGIGMDLAREGIRNGQKDPLHCYE